MLHTDNIEIEGIPFIHNYSDSGFMIEREDGKRFSDAKDLTTEIHTYIETDEPIPIPEPTPETDLTVADTLEILNEFGVDTSD